MSTKIIDCRSEEGITIGLIDSVITICRILGPRISDRDKIDTPGILEALKDLGTDEDFYILRLMSSTQSRGIVDHKQENGNKNHSGA